MSGHQILVATGHLGDDPTIRATEGGTVIAELRVAVTDVWKDRNGERVEHTEWLRIKAFGREAENAGHYLRKGRLVTVEGRLRTEKWQASDGSDRYSTWIYADSIQYHGKREHTETRREHSGREKASTPVPQPDDRPLDDDFAF